MGRQYDRGHGVPGKSSWPKFVLELSQFNPLNVEIAIINNNQSDLSEYRKISLYGSKKWNNKIKNLNNFLALGGQ